MAVMQGKNKRRCGLIACNADDHTVRGASALTLIHSRRPGVATRRSWQVAANCPAILLVFDMLECPTQISCICHSWSGGITWRSPFPTCTHA